MKSKIDLRLGDCIEVLKTLPDNSVDSIVTDPPYGIGFMGKAWDTFVPDNVSKAVETNTDSFKKNIESKQDNPNLKGRKNSPIGSNSTFAGTYDLTSKGKNDYQEWCYEWGKECFRVLKPGGHLLASNSPRMYHRMAIGLEDAGFEIRDQIMWVYGSGFPKSHNIGKAIDKRGGNNHLTQEIGDKLKEARDSRNITKTQADELFCNGTTNYMWFEGRSDGIRLPDDISFEKICNEWEELKPYQDLIKSANREVIGQYDTDMGGLGGERLGQSNGDITIPSTEAAKNWEGWGTALKPAHEPIVMARKPLSEKSIAENVLKHGTGGINIDGSRVTIGEGDKTSAGHRTCNIFETEKISGGNGSPDYETHEQGRFPANIIFDEEAGQLLDEQSGVKKSSKRSSVYNKDTEHTNTYTPAKSDYRDDNTYDDKGGASRFFYCPKAAKKDRNEGMPEEIGIFHQRPRREDGSVIYKEKNPEEWTEAMSKLPRKDKTSKAAAEEKLQDSTNGLKNNHPTVKPTDLMRYLINLITPPNGTILDPFMGSGSTGKAAVRCGVNFIGIEKEQEYMDIASARINHELNKPIQTQLF